jgi:hypothetical protein
MLYWTGDGPLDDPKAAKALGITAEKYSEEFVRRWASVVREYGERYKDKVAGWWVDGCLALWGYDEKKLGILAKALKAGNPERIIAFNVGAFPKVRSYSKWDDFTTGETREFTRVPDGRWTEGVQWHVLSWLGSTAPWGWASPGSRYRKRELADYVRRVNENGGVVSIDVMLYRDGSLDRSQLEMLRAIGPPAPKTQ